MNRVFDFRVCSLSKATLTIFSGKNEPVNYIAVMMFVLKKEKR